MLYKIAIPMLLALSLESVAGSHDIENFDKGKNFNVCMANCHDHHYDVLKLPPGSNKGKCRNICRRVHPGYD